MKAPLMLLALTAASLNSLAALILASREIAPCVVLHEPEATPAERTAARELAAHLRLITGAEFEVRETADVAAVPPRAILIGPGALSRAIFPGVPLDALPAEGYVMRTQGERLLLAGGRPRGTLYAVYRFLQEQGGVRWWTPWATNLPAQPTLRVPDLEARGEPAFEYREPFWFAGFDPVWKARNGANGENRRIPPEFGGCVRYKGFAHTFYPLVPPELHFATHPEWYSLINGQRTHERAQLCLANPVLRDFVVGRVKEWLREAPDANIISVTQNDWYGACQCAECKAIDDAEGSPAGSMITFVNYIAERIEPEFPHVAVDTFAYQYTRKPPNTVRPRPNVIVRLCSIECNFREPLDHPSNAAFLADLAGWAKICQRLYIWDYTTDFSNYLLPHPNWFTLGANVRLFQQYGVRGVFEQGGYQGFGGEMGELRAWVLAQLLWNPRQDDRALIREFLEGYYGPAAGPIGKYLETMHAASSGYYLGCFTKGAAPHRAVGPLLMAERLWQEAAAAVADDPALNTRVRLGHLPVRFAILREWAALRHAAWDQGLEWPLPESRRAVAEEFARVAQGASGEPWTVVNPLNESGLTVEQFVARLSKDPDRQYGPPPPPRLITPRPPPDLTEAQLVGAVDVSDARANLARPGEWAEVRPDLAASDLRAVWMPGTHNEWACQFRVADLPEPARQGRWEIHAVVRVEPAEGADADAVAFTAGVYDPEPRATSATVSVRVGQAGLEYRTHRIGTVELNARCYIYVAPANNGAVEAVWVDRVLLVKPE